VNGDMNEGQQVGRDLRTRRVNGDMNEGQQVGRGLRPRRSCLALF
jgi:hypothetical protein